jgi:hypothetical protein
LQDELTRQQPAKGPGIQTHRVANDLHAQPPGPASASLTWLAVVASAASAAAPVHVSNLLVIDVISTTMTPVIF